MHEGGPINGEAHEVRHETLAATNVIAHFCHPSAHLPAVRRVTKRICNMKRNLLNSTSRGCYSARIFVFRRGLLLSNEVFPLQYREFY